MQPAPTNNGVSQCRANVGLSPYQAAQSPLERVLMMPDLNGNDNAAVEYGELHERRIRARLLSDALREPSQQCASCGRHAPESKLRTTRLNHKVCGSQCARKLYIGPRDRFRQKALSPNDDDDQQQQQ